MAYQLVKDINKNIEYYDHILKAGENFDVINRPFTTGGRAACFYFVDGFVKDESLQKMFEKLVAVKADDFPKDAASYFKEKIGCVEAETITEEKDIIRSILSGMTVIFIDGFAEAIVIDARTYPARSVEEPEKDKVLRGSHDGFVETIVFNTALIRRRIRSPHLINEIMEVGKSSQTDIVVSYMEDRCNKKLLSEIKKRLQTIKVDSLTMNQESLLECLYPRNYLNPFPKVKFTERPDTAAACLLEGSILILVDNSPAAMIIPSSLFDIVEEADDYYFPPITGTYLRLSRFLMNLVALVLTPLFILFMNQPDLIPDWLSFIKVKETINIPLIWQFLILEFAVDGLKLASLSTPSMLTTPLSVIAGLVIGDFAVSSGWFNAETMLYMAFVVLSNYTQVNFELGFALKFMRILLLIATAVFGAYGFFGGLIAVVLICAFTKTLRGRNYIYPLIPFDFKKLMHKIFRVNITRAPSQEE